MMLVLIWIINYMISWWNAHIVGKAWLSAQSHSSWTKVVLWCAYLMSCLGFTWCYTVVIAYMSNLFGWIPDNYIPLIDKSSYFILAPLITLVGIVLWIDSMLTAFRDRSLLSVGCAGWNTFAMISNTYSLYENLGDSFSVFTYIWDKLDDTPDLLKILATIAAALALGFMQTRWICRSSMNDCLEYIKGKV